MKFKKGFCVFPVEKRKKKSHILDQHNAATDSSAQIAKWAKRWPGCNWGLACEKSGIVILDIEKAGLKEWAKITNRNEDPQTYRVMTGGGGVHYYFQAKPGMRYKRLLISDFDKIEIKHRNGTVNIPPSITSKPYRAVDEKQKIAEVPLWLEDMMERVIVKKKKKKARYKFAYIKKICDALQEVTFGYNDWLRIGMALHHYFKGSDKGYELFESITFGINYEEGDENEASIKWESFKNDSEGGDTVTIRTLIRLARDLGCDMPNPAEGEITPSFEKVEVVPQWINETNGMSTTDNISFLVDDINKQGLFMFKDGDIGQLTTEDDGQKSFKILKPNNFKNVLMSYRYRFFPDPEKLEPSYKPASQMWLQHKRRTTYHDVAFSPKEMPGYLNLWSAIPCKAKWGDTTELEFYIKEILCNGHQGKADYVTKYLAHLVQKPHEQSPISLVFIGVEGTGKGLLTDGLMKGILQRFQYSIQERSILKARFNKPLAFRFLTVLNESTWKGDKELHNALKRLTGGANLQLEEKFGGFYEVRNYSRYMITANEKDTIHLGIGNRRFLVIENSEKYNNHPRVKKLWGEVKTGELVNIFYDYLLCQDLTNFKPFDYPNHLDDGAIETKIESLNSVGRFWYDLFFENPAQIVGKKGIEKKAVFEAYKVYEDITKGYQKDIDSTKFWLQTRKVVGGFRQKRLRVEGELQLVLREPLEKLRDRFKEITRINSISDLEKEQYEIR